MQEYCIKTSSNICFGYLLELPHRGNSNKYPKHMLCDKNKTRSFLHIILSIKDSLQQQIHFNGNIFGKNAVIVTRVHCTITMNICFHEEISLVKKSIDVYTSYHPKMKIWACQADNSVKI